MIRGSFAEHFSRDMRHSCQSSPTLPRERGILQTVVSRVYLSDIVHGNFRGCISEVCMIPVATHPLMFCWAEQRHGGIFESSIACGLRSMLHKL